VWEAEGADRQQGCAWPQTQFCSTKGEMGTELCRAQLSSAAWPRQASNTGQDKGQTELLQPLNWVLLLKTSQAIQQFVLLPLLTQLQPPVLQLRGGEV